MLAELKTQAGLFSLNESVPTLGIVDRNNPLVRWVSVFPFEDIAVKAMKTFKENVIKSSQIHKENIQTLTPRPLNVL